LPLPREQIIETTRATFGAEFDEVITALDLFERGRDDCQWRPVAAGAVS